MADPQPHRFHIEVREYEYGPVDLPCCGLPPEHPVHQIEED